MRLLFRATRALAGVYTAALAADGNVTVEVGPVPAPDVAAPDVLMVGVSVPDDAEGVTDDATLNLSYAGLTPAHRDGGGQVSCVLLVQSGDTDITALWDRAETLAGLCEDAVTADPTLGGALTGEAGVGSASLRHWQGEHGAAVEVRFAVNYSSFD